LPFALRPFSYLSLGPHLTLLCGSGFLQLRRSCPALKEPLRSPPTCPERSGSCRQRSRRALVGPPSGGNRTGFAPDLCRGVSPERRGPTVSESNAYRCFVTRL
jgi:hypothetical protein